MSVVDLVRKEVMPNEKDFVATEPLYFNKEGKVVKHNDPSKIEKLADVGHRIPYERAKELGLVQTETKPDYEPPVREATEEEELQEAELQAKEKEGETGNAQPPDLSEMSKAELADYAKSLGIDVKSSWNVTKITDEIEALDAEG